MLLTVYELLPIFKQIKILYKPSRFPLPLHIFIASPRIETALFQKRIPFFQNFLLNMSNFKATKLTQFNPPGNLQDLTPANQKKWSEDKISGWMNLEISAKYPNGDPLIGGDNVVRSPLQAFFNGTVTAYDQGAATVSIPWTAFPNRVSKTCKGVNLMKVHRRLIVFR